MAKIYAPNKQYDGVSASVKFSKGVGECSDPRLISWFKEKGYTVEAEADVDHDAEKIAKLKVYADEYGLDIGEAATADEIKANIEAAKPAKVEALKAYATEKNIDLGKSTSLEGIMKKIQEAEAGK